MRAARGGQALAAADRGWALRLVSQELGVTLEFKVFGDWCRPIYIKHLTTASVPEAATLVAMLSTVLRWAWTGFP